MILRKIKRGESLRQFETWHVRQDGKTIPVAVTISPVYNKAHQILAAITIARNISQQKQVEAKLQYFADHDTLTGLIHHVILKDRITQSIAWAKRYQTCMAVCFMDIDNFKTINDTYGHALGDQVLATNAQRMQSCVREVDTISRVGGDEFALILLDIAGPQQAVDIIVKMRRCLAQNMDIDGRIIHLTCSFGIAIYPSEDDHSLLEKADAAMYYVKKQGKNNYKVFDELCHYRPTE